MRRFWIHHVLPVLFVAVPALAGGLVFAAIPPDARRDYLHRVAESRIDWIILGVGAALFLAQTAPARTSG